MNIRKVMMISGNKIPQETNFIPTFTNMMNIKLGTKGLFRIWKEHNLETTMEEEDRVTILIKVKCIVYCRIRLHNFAKQHSATLKGTDI